MAHIVILGAGLTGLSTAYHLEHAGCTDYLIFEQEETPGGLCRSVSTNGFTFDHTGHLLHSNDAATRPLVNAFVGTDNLATVTRLAWIESNGCRTPYPFQMYLYGRTPEVIAECIEGFVARPRSKKQPRMFTDWVNRSFGAGFRKHFFFPYQRKIFSFPPRSLTAGWTGRFVPQTDLATIIRGAVTPHTSTTVGYNATFLYPLRGGINSLINGMVKHLTRPILTGFRATHIDVTNKIVTFENGHQEPYDHLVSTLPLDELLRIVDGTHTQALNRASDKLLCNSVLNINLGIEGAHLPQASWFYYPDTTTSWYRVGFPHTFSPHSCPLGTQSLYSELSYLRTPRTSVQRTAVPRSSAHKNTAVEHEILSHFGIPREAVVARAPLMLKHAYVIYNTWRDQHVQKILSRLVSDFHIHSIGRYGAWKYASMQEALVDGRTTAHTVTNTFIPAHALRSHHEVPTHTTSTTYQQHAPARSIIKTGDVGNDHEA